MTRDYSVIAKIPVSSRNRPLPPCLELASLAQRLVDTDMTNYWHYPLMLQQPDARRRNISWLSFHFSDILLAFRELFFKRELYPESVSLSCVE